MAAALRRHNLFRLIIGLIPFAWMWFKNVVGDPVHRFSAGRSWLRPIGRVLVGFMNLFLNAAVRLAIQFLPKYKDRLNAVLPVVQDVDVFTEHFIEPMFVFFLSMFVFAMGQSGLGWLVIFSVMALNYVTGQRHRADRDYSLDIRDQMIEARFMREAMDGKESRGANRIRRMVNDAANEVEKSPETMETIKVQNPTLAEAIAAVQRKRNQANGLGEEPEMAVAA